MNILQEKVWDYLTVDDHPERKDALRVLVCSNYFGNRRDDESRVALEEWMVRWEESGGYCPEGLARAREALLNEPRGVTIQVLMEIEIVGSVAEDYAPTLGGGTVQKLCDLVAGESLGWKREAKDVRILGIDRV